MSDQPLKSTEEINGKRKWYHDRYYDTKIYERICSAKTRLLLQHPFWGYMGLDLVLVEAPRDQVYTLATDGYHIFYAADFLKLLSIDEMEFSVAHEIYHCIFGHTMGEGKVQRKQEDWDSDLWNRACDYVINLDLVNSRIGAPKMVDGKYHIGDIQICYDTKYTDMSAEEVYYDLLENGDNSGNQLMDTHIEFDIVPADGQAGDSDTDGCEGDTAPDGNSGASEGNSERYGNNGDGNDGSTGIGIKVQITESQYAAEKMRWHKIAQQAVMQVNTASQGAGSIPEHLLRLIGEINKPKIKWPTVLRRFVVSMRDTGFSWSRPDKKTFGSRFTLPGYRSDVDTLTIAVAIDASKSIRDDALNKFLSELMGIMKGYKKYEIHAFCFEASVDEATYMCITSGCRSADDNLKTYAGLVKGGGGTMFQAIWNFMKQKQIKPKGLVVFTDGYPCDSSWEKESRYCPSMFVTVDNRDGWKAPFGMTVAYEDA